MAEKNVAEQAGILLIGKIFSQLSEAVVPLVMARILSKTDFGVISAILVIYMTVSIILTAGFPNCVIFYLPGRPAAERRAIAHQIARALVGMGVLTGLLMALLPIIALIAPEMAVSLFNLGQSTKGRVGTETLDYLLVLSLLPIADVPARMLPTLLVVEGRARASAGAGIVQALMHSLAFIIPLLLGLGLWEVVIAVTVSGYLYALVILYYLQTLYRGVERIPSPIGARELLRFGVPLGLTEICSKLNEYVDRYLIMIAFPVAVFAEYHAGAWRIPMLTSVAYSVGNALAPKLAAMFRVGQTQEGIDLWRLSIRKVALIVMPITMVFIVASEEAIEVLFTAEFSRASTIFRLYAITSLGRVAAFGSVLVAAGSPQLVLVASALSVASNLLFSIPLLVLLGFEGPAVGTVLAFAAMVVAYCLCISRAVDLPFRRIFPLAAYSKVLLLTAVSSLPAWLYKASVDLPAAVDLAAIAVITLISYSLIGSLTRMIEREDWAYLSDWMRLKVFR
jgi:O-antigen/teichoic acid export membrane protein